jgi:hypothetical protein
MRLVVFGCVPVLVALVLLLLLHSDEQPPTEAELHPSQGDRGTQQQREVTTDEWYAHLREGQPVRFVSPAHEWDVESLPGPLDIANKRKLHSMFAMSLATRTQKLQDLQSRFDMQRDEDLSEEANLFRAIERFKAVQAMLESDAYVILRKGGRYPHVAKDATIVAGNEVVHDGVPAEVVFVVQQKDWPEYKRATEYAQNVARYRNESVMARFNVLPLETRIQRISEHMAAQEELRAGPPGMLGDYEKFRWKKEREAKLLPMDFGIDTLRHELVLRRS